MNNIKTYQASELKEEKTTLTALSLSDKLALLKDIKVTLQAELGTCELTVAELNQLQQGEIVKLNKQPGEFVDIILSGQVIAKGSLVVVDDNLGLKIEQIAEFIA